TRFRGEHWLWLQPDGQPTTARREVAAAGTAGGVLRVGVTAGFEGQAPARPVHAPPKRMPATWVELVPTSPERIAEALLHRSVDIALGLPPVRVGSAVLDVVPFLRYQRLVVAAPEHRLAGLPPGIPVQRAALVRERWFSGPAGVEEEPAEGRWLMASDLLPELVALASEEEARERAGAGEGLALLLGHVVRDDVRRGTLVRLAVNGTPVPGLWCASMLGHGRSVLGARALPPVHVTLGS
ncbi:MAG: substrate-binding domain-containing protein, partial [Frankiales bacterium]|nr:substrate-binding domain-containing protein [Frankiales bacterium]